MDVFTKDKRSEIMAKIGSKHSKPEILIRKLAHAMGYRFRLHRKDLPGTPDLAFPKHKKVIFINGCFWHGHKGCPRSKLPTTNAEFWEAKIGRNMANDKKTALELKKMGWRSLTLWTCEIKKKNIPELSERIRNFMNE